MMCYELVHQDSVLLVNNFLVIRLTCVILQESSLVLRHRQNEESIIVVKKSALHPGSSAT